LEVNVMRRSLALIALLVVAGAAGIAVGLASAPSARAWYGDDLARNGYATIVIDLGGGCRQWKASGHGAGLTDLGSDCDAAFQERLDAFINATCPCAQTSTSSTSSTTVTASTAATTTTAAPTTTTTATTTTADPLPTSSTTETTTSPATTTPATSTVVVTTTAPSPDLESRVAAVEQRLTVLEARVDELAAQVGSILGEPKNEPPFVAV
jgi:hypothetical protein